METKNNFINTDHKKVPQLPIDQYGARQSQVCPTKNEVGHIWIRLKRHEETSIFSLFFVFSVVLEDVLLSVLQSGEQHMIFTIFQFDAHLPEKCTLKV